MSANKNMKVETVVNNIGTVINAGFANIDKASDKATKNLDKTTDLTAAKLANKDGRKLIKDAETALCETIKAIRAATPSQKMAHLKAKEKRELFKAKFDELKQKYLAAVVKEKVANEKLADALKNDKAKVGKAKQEQRNAKRNRKQAEKDLENLAATA